MRIGYARVSTVDQNIDLQKDALSKAGCEKIITDVASGKNAIRNGLEQLRQLLRPKDVLAVWRLDRLGRSLQDLIALIKELEEQKIGFQSLQESIDTTSPNGKLTFHIFGALAEFERNLIQERTRAGLAAARARGRLGGRSKKLNATQRSLAIELYDQKKLTVIQICQSLGITKPTLYAYIRGRGGQGRQARSEPADSPASIRCPCGERR